MLLILEKSSQNVILCTPTLLFFRTTCVREVKLVRYRKNVLAHVLQAKLEVFLIDLFFWSWQQLKEVQLEALPHQVVHLQG